MALRGVSRGLGLLGPWTWWVALRFEGGIERNAEVMAAVDSRIAEFE